MGRFNIFDSDSIVEGEKRRFPWWALLLCLAAGMLAGWLLRTYCYMGGESGPNLSCVGRILAIDYGTKRTGIAVSDPLRLIAGGLDTVDTKGLEAWLAKYFASEDVSTIVVGKPSRMDGTPSETWRFIEPLAVRLRKAWPDKEVVFHDERFTSVMAHRTMLESGIGKMARRDKALVDKISATIILQSYMEFNK